MGDRQFHPVATNPDSTQYFKGYILFVIARGAAPFDIVSSPAQDPPEAISPTTHEIASGGLTQFLIS